MDIFKMKENSFIVSFWVKIIFSLFRIVLDLISQMVGVISWNKRRLWSFWL